MQPCLGYRKCIFARKTPKTAKQAGAARVITGKSYDVRSKDILEELSWQPLMERWGNNKAIFMHKVTNGECLENISSLFVVKNNDNYNLRNNNIDYTKIRKA